MLSQPSQIVKNVILLVVLLCVLTFCTACSTPAEVGPAVDSASRQPAHDAAMSEAQPVEDELVSSVFNSSSAKTQYTLGETFDETGLSLTLQYRSGKTDTVTSGFSSDLDTASPGEKDVHIQYQGENVGLLHVTVLRDAILEACDAGTGYDDDVRLISYGGKLYGIGAEYSGNALGDFFIYRKDSLSAAPVRFFYYKHISGFFILRDRIFFSAVTDDDHSVVASTNLNGSDYYELTDPAQDCTWCYYSSGWIYSYAENDRQVVRFRTNGSDFSSVVSIKSQYNPVYYVSNERVIFQHTEGASQTMICYDTTTGSSTVLLQTEPDQARLDGVYGDLLFYSVLNRPQNAGSDWDFIMYDLKSGSSTTLASGPNAYTYHALMLNGSIVVYTWGGDVSFRNPAAPIITTKEFTLPVEMRSGDAAGCRMVCAGDLLALNDGQQNIYLVNENNAVQAVLQADGSNAPEPASHAASDSDWEQVYGQFLSEYSQSLSSIDYTDHYALYDITGDGIPELFLMQQLEAGSPFDAYFIYTTDGASAVPLGQVPGTAYSLCPADGSGFLAVMQYMFCETVILYTYENGALHEQALLNEVPADKLPRNASTPLDETGYHILTRFQTYSVDDLSGLSEAGISSGSNQALVDLLQS